MTVPVQTAEPALTDTQIEEHYRYKHDLRPGDETTFFGHYLAGWREHEKQVAMCAALREGAVQPAEASPEPDETRRDDFERWADREGFNIHRDESDKYRGYHRATTRFAWQGWLAALAEAPTSEQSVNAAVPSEPK